MVISFVQWSWDQYNSRQKDDKRIFLKLQRLIQEKNLMTL